ncbi:MAG: response regulator [Methylococcales bacterium]|nr:response regulator [Methylococcales bacterium]MDD5754398.1 response regulator [Methylococcales bacterium]
MARILIIDDEEQLRDLLKQMLSRDGHEVVTAFDGVDGMRVFNQFNPELVITDIIMPNKDGIEVITELLCRNPNVAIIAISGGRRAITAEFNLESAEMLGVKGILSKPFTRDQLREAVQHALGL